MNNNLKIIELSNEYFDNYNKLMYEFSGKNYNINNNIKLDNRYIYIILDNSNNILGSATFFILNKIHCNPLAIVEDVIITTNYRGKGLGKYIINFIEKKTQELGCYKIILNCRDHNIQFYEKCGFKCSANEMSKYFKPLNI